MSTLLLLLVFLLDLILRVSDAAPSSHDFKSMSVVSTESVSAGTKKTRGSRAAANVVSTKSVSAGPRKTRGSRAAANVVSTESVSAGPRKTRGSRAAANVVSTESVSAGTKKIRGTRTAANAVSTESVSAGSKKIRGSRAAANVVSTESVSAGSRKTRGSRTTANVVSTESVSAGSRKTRGSRAAANVVSTESVSAGPRKTRGSRAAANVVSTESVSAATKKTRGTRITANVHSTITPRVPDSVCENFDTDKSRTRTAVNVHSIFPGFDSEGARASLIVAPSSQVSENVCHCVPSVLPISAGVVENTVSKDNANEGVWLVKFVFESQLDLTKNVDFIFISVDSTCVLGLCEHHRAVHWVQCSRCLHWFHCMCVKVPKTKASKEDFDFVCVGRKAD